MPAKLVQRRRGTTANHSVFAGAEGEITQDTTKNTLVSHDGNTQGGHPLAKEDMSNVVGTASGGGVGIVQLNLSDGGNGQVLTTDGSGNMSFQSIDVNNDMQLGGDLSGSISNAQIITNAVGLTELNVTAPSTGGQLLSADGSGNLQFITPASNMTLSGDVSGNLANTQIVAQAVGTPELATNAVTTVKISDLNVTSGKIADGSITSNKIAGLSVTTDKITDGNITLAKMADNSVRTGNIIDANVTTAKLAALSVDGTKIAAGAVDGTKIANNAVGITQLSVQADGNAGEVLSTNGSGVLSFIPNSVSSVGTGAVLQTQIVSTSTVTIQSANPGVYSAITDLQGSITPTATTSRIFLSGNVMLSISSRTVAVRIMRSINGGSFVEVGSGAQVGSRGTGHTGMQGDVGSRGPVSAGIHFVDTPSFSSGQSIVYRLEARDSSGAAGGWICNSSFTGGPSDPDQASSIRTISGFTMQELS